ncbi:MAG: alpha/beta hydrolase [Gemmatimonadetes bacterium]|nr:alpha/beta hydrolase [Gemmatimonadota bacterium]
MSRSRVSSAGRISAGLALLAAGYTAWVRRRNARLRRPPARAPDGVPYPSRRMIYSDGAEVNYLDLGAGVPVVMIPGADGMKETFRYQLPAFARRHRVIVADVRDRFSPEDTFDRLADDAAELMDERGVESAVVVGQSLGGAIAIRLATRYPERVTGLVVVNSLTHMTLEHLGLNRTGLIPVARLATRYLPTDVARLLADVWSRAEVWIFDNSPGRANIVEYVLWTGPRTVPSAVSKRRVDLFRDVDLRFELPQIRVPMLVVRGPRDFYMPPGWWEEMLAGVPGARCVEIPETGHCSHVSMPGAFNHAVLAWFAGMREDANRWRGGET